MRAPTGVILVLAVVGSIVLLILADQGSHSVSDTLYQWIVPAGLLWLGTGLAIWVVRQRER